MPSPEFRRLGLRTGALEGPVPDGAGGIYVSDLTSGVLFVTPDTVRTIIPDRPMVGGLARTQDGGLLVTGPSVELFDSRDDFAHSISVVLDETQLVHKAGTRPWFNDLAVDSDGRLWVGVIRSTKQGDRVPGEIYIVDEQGLVRLVHDDIYPNGIAFSPTTGVAYCSDTLRRSIIMIDSSSLTELSRINLASTPGGFPDGLAIDTQEHLWIALWRSPHLIRLSPDGQLDLVCDLDAWAYSLAFDPTDPHRLWVVTGPNPDLPESTGDILVTQVALPGVPGLSSPAGRMP